jgi:hypothetical protein
VFSVSLNAHLLTIAAPVRCYRLRELRRHVTIRDSTTESRALKDVDQMSDIAARITI